MTGESRRRPARSGSSRGRAPAKDGRRSGGTAGPRRSGSAGRGGAASREGSLDGLLASKEIVISCGPGGVGKTTAAAAAAAMAACHHGGKVLVLTIDPARRLADALGLEGLGNTERRIPDEAFGRSRPRGELWAAMLDTQQSWDALVRRHAPDARTRDAILANPLYRNISGRFVQSHDYIAMERLYDLHCEGDYDLIVVDTPPTRNALDFLDAPQRMADFFSSRLLRWLTVSYRSRMMSMASKPFLQVADRILGTQFLADIAEFFILFQSMYEGFVARAEAVTRLLSDRRTTFMVVSTLEAAPVREAEYFAGALAERNLPLGAIVLNKVLPPYFRDREAAQVAERLRSNARPFAEALRGGGGGAGAGGRGAAGAGAAGRGAEADDVDTVSRVLSEVADSFLNFGVVGRREAEQQAELAASPEVLATVPFFDADIVDMEGLLRLGSMMWS